jgi:hypothetical protein
MGMKGQGKIEEQLMDELFWSQRIEFARERLRNLNHE